MLPHSLRIELTLRTLTCIGKLHVDAEESVIQGSIFTCRETVGPACNIANRANKQNHLEIYVCEMKYLKHCKLWWADTNLHACLPNFLRSAVRDPSASLSRKCWTYGDAPFLYFRILGVTGHVTANTFWSLTGELFTNICKKNLQLTYQPLYWYNPSNSWPILWSLMVPSQLNKHVHIHFCNLIYLWKWTGADPLHAKFSPSNALENMVDQEIWELLYCCFW